jgi:isoleucyl-tRNA synthetase
MESFIINSSSVFSTSQEMHMLFDINRSGKTFDFMDGPPFATGTPHYGHIRIGVQKDTVLKFFNMDGYSCLNKIGYDCHGVPIESIANRELNINTLEDLQNIGMEKFNTFCKQKINSFEKSWEPIYLKMGRWANFDDVYKTIDKNFMESVWWAFSELYKKDMIYRSYKVTPYSYKLQSPLSNFEASQNYKEIDTRSIYVRFKLCNEQNTFIVVWTTTPWTLPSNIALCVNSDLDYDYIQDDSDIIYIIGKEKHKNCSIKMKKILKTVKGSDLIGMRYEPLYDYFVSDKYHYIVSDKYVQDSGTTGTDVVHIAPFFGEDDYRVCKEQNIITDEDIVDLEPIDKNCVFNYKIKKYVGRLVFDVETDIIKELKERYIHLKTQQIKHEYPYCYRTDTPLVYKVCKSFYVDVQKIKIRMIQLNLETNWFPSNVGNGRFHKWLEGAKDWCISRTRYFGNPIPVWECISDPNDIIVIDSVEQLENLTNTKLNDLHPEYVNNLEITKMTDEGLKTYKRVDDIFDCWFESGSVPFAQYHYPFENKNKFDNKQSMCDFICEGIDQTRGWFYTLFVLSVALFDKKPAENIMVMGLVLDEHKKKLSKKNQNYTDPTIIIDKYGADSLRLYLLQSSFSEPLPFKEDELKNINKDLFQFKNCIDFLIEHTTNQKFHNVIFDKFAFLNTKNPMDLWIMQHINQTGYEVTKLMRNFDVARATRKLIDLIEDITNWYLKFNRDRLKGKCGNEEWIKSTSVFAYVIHKYLIMLTPFAPFITQTQYDRLNQSDLIDFKYKYIQEEKYEFVEQKNMDILDTFCLLKKVSRMVRTTRMSTKTHTSSKTPIKFCEICMDCDIKLKQIESCIDLIQSELNIIDIKYSKLEGNLKYKYVPNKALLGKKYKKFANEIYKYFEKSDFVINDLEYIKIKINDIIYEITPEEYTKEIMFDSYMIFEDNILIRIDFTYDENIDKISHLKRFLSQIQQTRKEMGLHPWDKILIEVSQDDFDIISKNIEYMKKRLECDVVLNECEIKTECKTESKTYEDEDTEKKIKYFVKLL